MRTTITLADLLAAILFYGLLAVFSVGGLCLLFMKLGFFEKGMGIPRTETFRNLFFTKKYWT
jgi:hypothetical protein